MPSISVIIPAYNAEKYIGEAIESALAQTRPAQEILVVDDASADRTVEVVRGFGERVRVLVNPANRGPGHCRNAGVAASTGKYLAFLDSDDIWMPGHLESLGRLMDEHSDLGIAFCPVIWFGDRTGQWPASVSKNEGPRDVFLEMIRNITCVPSAMMVRRTGHEAIGGFDEGQHRYRGRRIQAEDLDYVIRLSLEVPVMADEEPSARYRVHPEQASVIRVQQVLLAFHYRLRILLALAANPRHLGLLQAAQDKVIRCWEEHIEAVWAERDMVGLRQMIRFGLRNGLLRKATWPYLGKAGLPRIGVGILDRLHR
ncbi:MAG TPA: glycosyltransferase [Kiritimatiellia bacterium]|nr:glycosyltransferase [Kiritimatiellia bacterium]